MKSYLIFLKNNKLYSFIEAVGLAFSLAFVVLLGTYIWQQYGVINENPDADRIYIMGTEETGAGLSEYEKMIFDADPLPGVEIMARYSFNFMQPVQINDELRLVKGAYVDKEWFELFPYYEMVAGSPELFNDASNVFVSRSFANSLGGEDKAIGITIVDMQNEISYVVAGVMEDFKNTLFQNPDILFNARSIWPDGSRLQYSGFGGVYTFTKLAESVDANDVKQRMIEPLNDAAPMLFKKFKPALYTIEETYFQGKGSLNNADKTMLHILTAIVMALLISAIFNYINLTFALITKRAKEMATRRLVGAGTQDIIFKCILESVFFTVVCFVAAILIAIAFEPTLNSLLVGKNPYTFVPIDIPLNFGYIAVCLLATVILGTVVGVAPAISASAFQPIDVVKGSFRAKSKMFFSKIFIIVQNTMAVILIAMAILMEVQLAYMHNTPMNANTKNIFYLESEFLESPQMAQPLYDALMKNPSVKRVGFGIGVPGHIDHMKAYIAVEDMDENVLVKCITCDSSYFAMLNPQIAENYNTPLSGSLWLGESTARAMNVSDSTESRIYGSRFGKYAETDHLGGVIKDIPVLPNEIGYCALEVIDRNDILGPSIIIETVSQSSEVRKSIIETYEQFSKECIGVVLMSQNSGFISEIHETLLAPTVRIIHLVEIFMFLAVILSLLGLVAMSTYFSEQKSKDIAVRKVFGGTVTTETLNSIKSYMLMSCIACIIGTPIAIYIAGKYLEQFKYKIDNTWWIFALAIILALAISLLSVLWQTLKAAHTNPATELKKE